MNRPLRFFLILRLAVYVVLIAYLAGDFSLNGPLSRSLKKASPNSRESIARAKANTVVATIGDRTISHAQLDRATSERLWLEGKNFAGLSPIDQKIARYSALADLIDSELLNQKIAASGEAPGVTADEINSRLRRLLGRFETKGHLETAMKLQGIPDGDALRSRMENQIRQEKFIDSQIAPLADVSDEEVRAWFRDHRKDLEVPERIKARHVFVPTLGIAPDQAKAILEAAFSKLRAGERFEKLAADTSMDPATKDRGGELGWMTRDRLPDDFGNALFDLVTGKPALFQTKLGWHLAEVTDRKPSETPAFEEAAPEIRLALRNVKRNRAILEFRDDLRNNGSAVISLRHDIINK